ncbi:MAG: PhoH family protein [Deltaproteobacteria bacterium]|nr:PhoH family protein [Deltaproteobacteria bacterium]
MGARVRTAPVVFVTGKGGVGKTTVAAALALDAARGGGRSLLVELRDPEAGARALGASLGQIEHVVVKPGDAVVDAVAGLLGSRVLARLLVRHWVVRRLVAAAPGVSELAALEAIRALAARGGFERMVVDLPSAGHAIGWLKVASAVARFARIGPFHDLASRVDELVRDPDRSTIVVVALPEPLVLGETRELCDSLEREIGRRPEVLIVNRVPADDGPATRALGDLVAADETGPAAHQVLALLEARAARVEWARAALNEASELVASRRIELPEGATDPSPRELVDWLDAAVANGSPCPA